MLRALFFLMLALAMFSSCVEEPAVGDAAAFIDRQIADQQFCGDGIVQSWEVCEPILSTPCSEAFPELYARGMTGCSLDCLSWLLDDCYLKTDCRAEHCADHGECVPHEDGYSSHCLCDEGYAGVDCRDCAEGYHPEGTICKKNLTCDELVCGEHAYCVEDELHDYAVCRCEPEYQGSDCMACATGYHPEGTQCVENIPCTADSCSPYEICEDETGLPLCSCNNEHHDPLDCANCLPDYDMVENQCINSRQVFCAPNATIPDHAHELTEKVTISYSDATGWSEPDLCRWYCESDYFSADGKTCSKFIAWKYDIRAVSEYGYIEDAAVGLDDSAYIITGNGTVLISLDRNGQTKWVRSAMSMTKLVVRQDGMLIAGSTIYNPDGEIIGHLSQLEGSRYSPALASDGTTYHDERAFDIDGRKKFYGVPDGIKAVGKDGILFATSAPSSTENRIYALAPDGTTLWSNNLGTPDSLSIGPSGHLYVPTDNSILSFYKEKTPELVASLQGFWIMTGLTIDGDGSFYLLDIYNKLLKINGKGDKEWISEPYSNSAGYGLTPVLTKNCVLVMTSVHMDSSSIAYRLQLTGYAYDDGRILWNAWTDESTREARDFFIDANGRLFFYTMYALYVSEMADFTPLKNAYWPMKRHDAQRSNNGEGIGFNHAPSRPTTLSPTDSQNNVTLPAALSWSPSSDEDTDNITYDVRFGSSAYELNVLAKELTSTTRPVPTDTSPGTYYWQVLAKDSRGSVTFSDIWSFTITE